MATGRDRHQARLDAVNALGKTLTRRAASVCELCGSDQDLRVVEVPPLLDEPDEERALLGCARCRELVDGGRLPREAAELRFIDTAVWADPVPVKLAAIRLLRALAEAEVGWARETLDTLWVPEDVSELL